MQNYVFIVGYGLFNVFTFLYVHMNYNIIRHNNNSNKYKNTIIGNNSK